MKQHGASLQFGFISRGFLAGLAIAGVAFSYGCSVTSTSSPNGGGSGAKPGTTGPVVDASKLGQDCSGGTSIGDSVAFNDTTCGAGVCIVDATGNDLDTYCSADCSNAQCPTGYICKATTIGGTNDCFIDPNAPAADAGSSGTTAAACTDLGTYQISTTQDPANAGTTWGCYDIPAETTPIDDGTGGAGCTQSFDQSSCVYASSCAGDDVSNDDTTTTTNHFDMATMTGTTEIIRIADDTKLLLSDCKYNVTLVKQ